MHPTGPSGPGPPVARRSWSLAGRPGGRAHPDDRREFVQRLTGALRVGHGLGACFGVQVDFGSGPSVRFTVRDAISERWATRALLPAYGESGWTTVPATRPPSRRAVLAGRRTSLGLSPTSASEDSFLDLIALGAGSLRLPCSLAADFSPLPPARPLPWEREPIASRLAFEYRRPTRTAPPTPVDRPSAATDLRPSQLLGWNLHLALAHDLERESDGDLDTVARLVDRASRSIGPGEVRFRRSGWGSRRHRAGVFLTEEELVRLLPSRDGGVGPALGTHGGARPTLALGRVRSGQVVGPPIEPHQGRHLAVLGETGMGKSSLLAALVRRVVGRHGVVLLDPLGETARGLDRELEQLAPARVLRIDPVERPLGLNALEGMGSKEGDPVRAERRLTDLVHALRRVRAGRYTDSAYWGPRLEEVLTRAVRAASELDGGTLADAHTLLATGARSPRGDSPAALSAVRELAERIRERPEDAEGARRLVYEVVRSPVLRNMLCARSPDLRARDLVHAGRITVVSGDASRVGESTARYLLQVYLAILWSELLARDPPSKTFVVLDEVQWFAHESLAEMLRLGRRSNVHVVLATQGTGSLPEQVAEALWTNVSDWVAFRGSPEEARSLARVAPSLKPEEILALPRGRAALLLGKGESVHWIRTVRSPNGVRVSYPRAPPSPPGTPGPTGSSARAWGPSTGSSAPGPGNADAALGQGGPGSERRESGALLDLLRSRARAVPPGGALRVSLAELRQWSDPEGNSVRAVGATLGRLGAIRSTEHPPSGTAWVLDADRLGNPVGETPVSRRKEG